MVSPGAAVQRVADADATAKIPKQRLQVANNVQGTGVRTLDDDWYATGRRTLRQPDSPT